VAKQHEKGLQGSREMAMAVEQECQNGERQRKQEIYMSGSPDYSYSLQ